MRWVLRFLRALRVVLMLLLLGLTVLLYVVLETPYGLKLANTFLPLFLPFALEIDAPRGALLDNLYANKVVYRDDVVEVTVKNPSLRLDAVRLFFGEIKVDNVTADDVSVIILDNGEPSTLTRAKLLKNLTLPFSLKLTNSTLKHLVVGEAHQKPWVDLQQANVSALMDGEPHFTVNAEWNEGQLHLIPDVPLHSINGQFSVDGKLPNYNVIFNSQLQFGNQKNMLTAIIGQGDFNGLNLSAVNLRHTNDSNTMDAPMQITWLPHFQWTIPSITGKIHGYPLSGHIALRNDGSHWQVDDSEVKVHDASLQMTGLYKHQGQFSFKLAIPHMETLIAGSKGHLFANGEWSGTATNPQLNADINAGDMSINKDVSMQRLQGHLQAKLLYPQSTDSYSSQFYMTADLLANQIHSGEQSLDSANLHFEGATDIARTARLHAEVKNLHLNDSPIESLILDIDNKAASQKANMALNWGSKKIIATATGHYQNNIWQGALESLQTNFNMRLQKRNAILISSNKLQVDSTCFNLNKALLCADLNWQKEKSFNAKVNGKNIPINSVTQFFLPKQKIDGTFSLDADMSGDGHIIQSGNFHFALSDGSLTDDSGDKPIRLPFRASHINVTLSQKGLTADGDLNMLKQPPIRWQVLAPKLNLNDADWAYTPVSGYLQFSTQQLAPLAEAYPQLRNIKGTLSADVKISGTLMDPKFLGSLQFKGGQLDVPSLGLHLSPIEFSAEAQNNKITYNGRINTNPGLLTIQGYSDLNSENPKTELQISGNAITAIHTSEYQVSASPQLHLTWFNQLLDVEGQITIPNAKISPIDLGDTVTLSNDVVFVNGKEKKQKTRLPIRTHVKIILGDKIFLNVKGVTARLAGNVDIQENENSEQTTAVGQINLIGGRYKAHGQNLVIRAGRAIFTGSTVTNPAIYAEVVRTVSVYAMANTVGSGQSSQQYGALQSDVIVGARITGTVDVPQVTFFSEPSTGLTQSQILSYLVLGKGQSSGSDLDTTLLLKAVSFLDIGGKETAATKSGLEKGLGLDEIGVQSGQEYSSASQSLVNNTSLVLGKALSPKLFVDYSIGLIEPINILRIRYQLSKHFILRSESNANAQGIDVFYNIER
jgi:autotransporter translocation and assembly factor TamB